MQLTKNKNRKKQRNAEKKNTKNKRTRDLAEGWILNYVHCKKNWSENKSLFKIPIPPTVFSISAVQNLCSSPLAFFKIIEVGN